MASCRALGLGWRLVGRLSLLRRVGLPVRLRSLQLLPLRRWLTQRTIVVLSPMLGILNLDSEGSRHETVLLARCLLALAAYCVA